MSDTSAVIVEPQSAAPEPARLDRLKRAIRAGAHKPLRSDLTLDLAAEFDSLGLAWPRRVSRAFARALAAEQPVILADETIAFTRTLKHLPTFYTPEAGQQLTAGRRLHELGPISNICADWGAVLADGLLERRHQAQARLQAGPSAAGQEFLECAIETIDAVLDLAARYAACARSQGRDDIADTLDHVPAHPPQTFRQALQSLRLLHSMVWLEGHYHVGLGRLDQYLWPYLESDLAAGRLDLAEAEQLLAEFFILLNKDSDLYPGVQQGDNGQTAILGGVRPDGSDGVNELTRMALRAALYTSLIDPKINLRISPSTDLELLRLATRLTRQGLGFPQYSNDDVVIPALISHGYEPADARNYGVAACWEFLIPGRGMEIVNIGAVSLPLAADRAIRQGLTAGLDFAAILDLAAADIAAQTRAVVDSYRDLLLPPSPFYSVLMDGCLSAARDLSDGLRYNNYGVHGAAAANAADALAAVEQFVFKDRSVAPAELLAALDSNFEGYEALRQRLIADAPKVARDDAADSLMVRLYSDFASACEAISDNGRRGRIRPGTGSAMYYVWLARGGPGDAQPPIGATADGRRSREFFSANLAPSPNAQVRGPFSVLQSFSLIDYSRIINGGPITIELSDLSFEDEESLDKCALLVRTFAQLGCQQMQLNALNAEKLIDAKRRPELYRNLIVRVWGWSGYFCELAPEYQDHVIARQLYRF